MSLSTLKGKPISILKITKEKVTIDTQAIKSILEKIGNHHFVIYSINGPKRTGKSFMLSNFIRHLNQQSTGNQGNDWVLNSGDMNNFTWRGGSERQTTGIDVWSEPFWTTNKGRRIAVLLMDTQGSFDDQTTMQQNAIIFAISTLLSSVLIFNIKNDVGEDVLQFFQFFSSFATLTIPQVEGDSASLGHGSGAFQKLVFLIRDFQFVQDYEFGFYDDSNVPQRQDRRKNYKKDKLDSNPDQPTEVRFTHDQVVQSYRDVGVYLMPEPDKGLKQRDTLDNLDPEFATHVADFITLMLSPAHLVTKQMGGVEVTGFEMIKYIKSWATLFDGNELPEIKSVYHSAAESQFIIAKRLSLTFYATEMEKFIQHNSFGVGEPALVKKHSELVKECFAIYKSKSKLGGANMDAKFSEEFAAESDPLFATYKSVNDNKLQAQERERKLQREIEAERKANHDLKAAVEAQNKQQERAQKEAKERDLEFQRQLNRQKMLQLFQDLLVPVVAGTVATAYVAKSGSPNMLGAAMGGGLLPGLRMEDSFASGRNTSNNPRWQDSRGREMAFQRTLDRANRPGFPGPQMGASSSSEFLSCTS
ncbi:atlastin [Folsomia candida]|uniref:Atlastin-2 n=1 Tax=Folsomia candida TaxID=158441 RepID=A0A226EGV3_FOLCA|nr:atlastin [Folsomia candida]OXA55906.1 Atlastin-2 [Folsomia candida]